LFGGDTSFLIEKGKEDIGAMQTNSCLRDRNYMLHACGVTDGTKIASTSAICLPPTRIMMMLLLFSLSAAKTSMFQKMFSHPPIEEEEEEEA
jgi:hypothetical protein